MTECKGYIIEIQKLNNEKADLDVELNHRNSVVMRLETQIETYKKNTDSKFNEVIITLEGDIEKLKRELVSRGEECNGYIKEIELLNQEIFRLKEQLVKDPNRFHTEYVIGQKEQKVAHEVIVAEPSISSSEITRYEMSPKRMVTVRSPFDRKDDESSSSTNVTTTKYTRIQRSSSPLIKVKVDPSSEEPSVTATSDDGSTYYTRKKVTKTYRSESPGAVKVRVDSPTMQVNVDPISEETMTATSDDGTTVYTKKITKSYRSESPGGVKVRVDSPSTQMTEYRSESSGGSFQGIAPFKVSVDSNRGVGFESVGGRLDEYTTKGRRFLFVCVPAPLVMPNPSFIMSFILS